MKELLLESLKKLEQRRAMFDDAGIAMAWVALAEAEPSIVTTTGKGVPLVVARKTSGHNKVQYEAFVDGRKPRVAWMHCMAPMAGRVQVTNANVYEINGKDWRRQGIGTAVYDVIERDVLAAGGQGVEPHWGSMSEAAIAFLKQRRPEHADKVAMLNDRLGIYASGLSD